MGMIYTNKLLCDITICGTSNEGESIVILLESDNDKKSIVIDSFCADDAIVPLKVLKEKGIENIDYLIWTHPHKDHTTGMKELLDKKISHILIPYRLDSFVDNLEAPYQEIYSKIEKFIKDGCNGNKKEWTVIKFIDSSSSITVCEYNINASAFCDAKLVAFSPDAQRLTKVYKKNDPQINDLSVGMDLIVGDFVISLASDVENNTIGYDEHDDLGIGFYPNIIKIPHHGSENSNKILSLYNRNEMDTLGTAAFEESIGVTTSKKSSGLPESNALADYKNALKHVYRIDPKSNGLSLIEYQVDIVNATIKMIKNKNFIKI